MNYLAVMSAFRLLVIPMALTLFCPSLVWAAEEPVAFILRVSPGNALEKKLIVVERQGVQVDFSKDMTTLYNGDRIFVRTPEASLALYVNNQQEQNITAQQTGKNGYVLQTKPNSILRNILALLDPTYSSIAVKTITASAARGKVDLNMPADAIKPSPKMAAGERVLHFRWLGGEPPYHLTILQHDQVVTEVEVAEACAVSLPKRDWLPGEYQLVLRHSVGLPGGQPQDYWQEDRLTFVAPADVPPMPKEIAEAELREDMRQLLYAGWLSRQDEGDWIMEAIQHVAPFAEQNLTAANWLRQWGGE